MSGATSSTANILPGNSVGIYIVAPSVTRSYTDATLVRTRGQLTIRQSGNAFTAGAAGIISWDDIDDSFPLDRPRPFLDADQDWIWHSWFHMFALTAGSFPQLVWSDGNANSIDSKAMRKLGHGKGVMFVVENGITSVNSIDVGFGARCLLKE